MLCYVMLCYVNKSVKFYIYIFIIHVLRIFDFFNIGLIIISLNEHQKQYFHESQIHICKNTTYGVHD